MTEEQLKMVKDEAEEAAEFANTFIGLDSHNLQKMRSTALLFIKASFIDGARFGFRLAETEKQFTHDGEYKAGGTINDKV